MCWALFYCNAKAIVMSGHLQEVTISEIAKVNLLHFWKLYMKKTFLNLFHTFCCHPFNIRHTSTIFVGKPVKYFD